MVDYAERNDHDADYLTEHGKGFLAFLLLEIAAKHNWQDEPHTQADND